ncbi:MAG TPA: glycosyltransferase family 1 protein [Candidatus Bathyarchaeota archaeon]|nr:glycosyltransferase family 1 protein [Candidatus Bathyarchaeota archaeon]
MNYKLRVLMFSWEYPPRVVGGISPHVYYVSKNLAKNGVEIYVVTCDFPGAPSREVVDGVHVLRVDSYKNPAPDFATWIYLMNMNMRKEAAELIRNLDGEVDILHAHDWLVASATIGLKHVFRIPLVATIHSTEFGRRNGIHTDYERMIHETERWLTYEAWKVVCCSNYMVSHVAWVFGVPSDKLIMIPNGVNAADFQINFNKEEFRRKYALPEEKLVLFVGRLVYEKGAQVLIEAVPKILSKVNAKFVIVGDGYMRDPLLKRVQAMGLLHKVLFTGFVDDWTLKRLYNCADVCVVPSLYEPFGITALEAMASKAPLVASDTGGLSEIVEHDRTGVKVYVNNPDSLAWGVTRILLNPDYAEMLKENAYRKVLREYDWNGISIRLKNLYSVVREEYQRGSWKP